VALPLDTRHGEMMNASELQRTEWLDPGLWDRLELLERRHRRAQWEHRLARRDLERLSRDEAEALRFAWLHYCEVIAELDRTTADIEALRRCTRRGGSVQA
jgi:hypothetical protein